MKGSDYFELNRLLRQWKAEASEVLNEWDEVFNLTGPHESSLGQSKPAIVLQYVKELLIENASMRVALRKAAEGAIDPEDGARD